ncbi:unnamed protein product [Jaminaea pallidilutea]
MTSNQPTSRSSWDQGTLRAMTPPIPTAPRNQWANTHATSAAAAYQNIPAGTAYSRDEQPYASGNEHEGLYSAPSNITTSTRQGPMTAQPGSKTDPSLQPPYARFGPAGTGAYGDGSPSESGGEGPGHDYYPPKSYSRKASSSPMSGTQQQKHQHQQRPQQRKRRNSQDWAKLMKDAGYSYDPSEMQAGQTAGLGSKGQVKGPVSWLRHSLGGSRILSWFFWIVPAMAVLWVPGIIALLVYGARPSNNFSGPSVFEVGIFWWSVWLSGIWLGWWICRAIAGLLPRIFKKTVGSVQAATRLGVRQMLDYLISAEFYVALFLQTVLIWVLWLTIVWNHYSSPAKYAASGDANPLASNGTLVNGTAASTSSSSTSTSLDSTSNLLVTISRFWFGLVLCTALLLVEKLIIQTIAYNFHQATYADRLSASRFQVAALANLFEFSSNSIARRDTVLEAETRPKKKGSRQSLIPFAGTSRAKGTDGEATSRARTTQQGTSTVLGNIANEMRGQKGLLKHASPRFIVLSALESSKETRKLARRIFYSYAEKDPTAIGGERIITIASFHTLFPDPSTAAAAFGIFDKDSNGSLTREELEASCLEIMRDRLALENSMHDVDSAVNSLDSCFMSIYILIAAVIIAAMLSTKFSTLVTSLGSVILGLSWLFSSSAAETFTSIVFLLAKHPIDTGDRVEIPGMAADGTVGSFEVVQLGLLSTVFKSSDGSYVQVSNALLSQKAITNHRRSGPIEEFVKLDVAYATSLAQLEGLRNKMVAWLDNEGRDFRPGLNISITSLGDQSKMSISTGIRYKSNWQDGGLRARRRNRWMCALRAFLAEMEIYGPSGDPTVPTVNRVAMVDPPAAAAPTVPDVSDNRGAGSTAPPEYKLMDSKQPPGDALLTPGGLGGMGQGSGVATTGYNTPNRAGSPVNEGTRRRFAGGGGGGGGGSTNAGSGGPPHQAYEMGKF